MGESKFRLGDKVRLIEAGWWPTGGDPWKNIKLDQGTVLEVIGVMSGKEDKEYLKFHHPDIPKSFGMVAATKVEPVDDTPRTPASTFSLLPLPPNPLFPGVTFMHEFKRGDLARVKRDMKTVGCYPRFTASSNEYLEEGDLVRIVEEPKGTHITYLYLPPKGGDERRPCSEWSINSRFLEPVAQPSTPPHPFKPGDRARVKHGLIKEVHGAFPRFTGPSEGNLEAGDVVEIQGKSGHEGLVWYIYIPPGSAPHQCSSWGIPTEYLEPIPPAPESSVPDYKPGDRARFLVPSQYFHPSHQPFLIPPGAILTLVDVHSDQVSYDFKGYRLWVDRQRIEPSRCVCSWDVLWNCEYRCQCGA